MEDKIYKPVEQKNIAEVMEPEFPFPKFQRIIPDKDIHNVRMHVYDQVKNGIPDEEIMTEILEKYPDTEHHTEMLIWQSKMIDGLNPAPLRKEVTSWYNLKRKQGFIR